MRYNFWVFLWDSFDLFYMVTGLRAQSPIEIFFPEFGHWLFGKMIGRKGVKICPPACKK